jgi:hypothetical protein
MIHSLSHSKSLEGVDNTDWQYLYKIYKYTDAEKSSAQRDGVPDDCLQRLITPVWQLMISDGYDRSG